MKNMSFRDLEELLLSSEDMCRVLGLRAVPEYSTFNRAYNRVSGKQIQKLLEKTLEVIGIGMVGSILFACDSTGFKEDSASFYYALRSGKKRKRWIKAFYLLDTRTQICVSQVIGRGPSGDARGLCQIEKKSCVIPFMEVMDRGFDGNGNIRLGFPIRIIPPIRRSLDIVEICRTPCELKCLDIKVGLKIMPAITTITPIVNCPSREKSLQ